MSKDTHITYLFGAGASYNSMPVVSEINDDLRILDYSPEDVPTLVIPRYRTNIAPREEPIDGPLQAEWMYPLENSVAEIMHHIDAFSTIDTLAKYWSATKNKNLQKLKKVVNLYFALRHFCPEIAIAKKRTFFDEKRRKEIVKQKLHFDPRYDALIAGLVSAKDGSHDERVSYISYNYDLELEQSLAKFRLNTLSGEDGKIPIYHVNGHCTNLYGGIEKDEEHKVKAILEDGGAIKYAWEADETSKEEVRSRLANTTHLVVIGYSFPVFNREIDREILKARNLKKIYLQDLPTALDGIENRVRALLGRRGTIEPPKPQGIRSLETTNRRAPKDSNWVKIETINSTDQFHIPFELI